MSELGSRGRVLPNRHAPGLFTGLLSLAMLLPGSAGPSVRRFEPRFFALDRSVLREVRQDAVAPMPLQGEKQPPLLYLLSGTDGQPLLFFTDITLSVCLDNVCDPVRIELYWDLVGNYAGYGEVPGQPLLKYDHQPFEPADYAKLQQVLSDRDSILGKRPLASFLDAGAARKTAYRTKNGQPVDAVSGPTAKEIAESIVPGALYSCYGIWNAVHGDVRAQIASHLRKIFNKPLAVRFLGSDLPDYQAWALRESDAAFAAENLPRILELFANSPSFVQSTILDRLPPGVWARPDVTRAFSGEFRNLDAGTRDILIRNLEFASTEAAVLLVDRIEVMNKDQLQRYLAYLAGNPVRLAGPVRNRLRDLAAAERYAYCYVITDFLRTRQLADEEMIGRSSKSDCGAEEVHGHASCPSQKPAP